MYSTLLNWIDTGYLWVEYLDNEKYMWLSDGMKKKRKPRVLKTEVHYCGKPRYMASSKVLGLRGPERMIDVTSDIEALR